MLKFSVRALLITSSIFFGAASFCAHSFSEQIVYPRPESSLDKRHEYPLTLLQLALSKIEANYTLKPSEKALPQARALLHLSGQDEMDVVWTMTSKSREQEFLPIRIPIYKGLIGWRVALIQKLRREKLAELENMGAKTSEAFIRNFTILQGSDWPDREILETAGFSVRHTYYYEKLFEMLGRSRGDLYLRSVVEVWPELVQHRHYGLDLDPYVLFRYPTAFYFFVHKDNVTLAKIIRAGLVKSIEDGSFDKTLIHYLGDDLKNIGLASRFIIDLENPLLPEKTPLNEPSLWFQMEQLEGENEIKEKLK